MESFNDQEVSFGANDDLYIYALYCEGHGLTQSKGFATIQSSQAAADQCAMAVWTQERPLAEGWTNHQLSQGKVPRHLLKALVGGWTT